MRAKLNAWPAFLRMKVEPVTLRGTHVVLEPLSLDHVDELASVGLDQDLWKFTVVTVSSLDQMREHVEQALAYQASGNSIAFATRDLRSDKIVGSTRFGNIDAANRRAEIGWTWVTPEMQRTAVNTEAKLLMLTHAFETWGCIRVEFKTDATNLRSRNAILRLGAKEEGTLRQHMITHSGGFRDTVYFSILDSEWPGVKAGLVERSRKYE